MAHFSRRTFLGAASLWAATTSAATRVAVPARQLDLNVPADNVTAYLKMRAGVETRDLFFWFSGRLDLAVPGESIKPIIDVDSLILRRVERLGPLAWNVIDWEASLYRPIGEDRYLTAGETVVNPHTGRAIEPLHYIEGPVRWRFTDEEPRIFGSRDPLPRTGKPFGYPWRIVAGDIWMTKSSYIEAPHWLQPGDWPLESSGEKLIVATHSSLRSSLTDVQDSRVDSAPADFAYSATSSWLPWMLMGQTPGQLIWSESGKKLFSLDEAPAAQIEMIRRVHPQWFRRPEPWPEFTNMFMQYKAARKPQASIG